MKLFFFLGGMILFASIAVGRQVLDSNTSAPTATPTVIQATPTAAPTLAPVTAEPVRVQFKRGAWGETLAGTTSTKYILWAAQGQTFTTTLTSAQTALASLFGPDGKPLYEQMAPGNTAVAKLPGNGDYMLEVRSQGAFTVAVTIR